MNNSVRTYGHRSTFFAVKEVGCGGLDIWTIQPPCYKNSSGSTVATFSDWQSVSVWVDSESSVLVSSQSYQALSYPTPNGYNFTSNYMLSGSEFYFAVLWPMVRYGDISIFIG